DAQTADKGIDRFWMERCETVSRIGFEPEHFTPLPCPVPPRRMVLIRCECASDDASIAQPVEDRAAVDELDAAGDMRMMRNHGVGSAFNRGLGQRPFIGGKS